MPKDSRYIQMAFSVRKMLESGGQLDESELEELLALALKDGEIDDDERRVLGLILNQLQEKDVGPGVWPRIAEVKKRLAL